MCDVSTSGVRIPYTSIISVSLTSHPQRQTLTQAHRDTIAIPLRMQHMFLRPETEVPHHLHSLCILHLDMVFFNHRLHEMLVNKLAERPPQRSILHSKQVTATRNCVGNVRLWPVAVFGAFPINEFLDDAAVCDHNSGSSSYLEGVETAILLGPFGESVRLLLSIAFISW